jgi:hypothetical protein
MIYKYVCKRCGSDEINAAAYVNWDARKQEWVFMEHIDSFDSFCMSCRNATEVDWVPVTDLRTIAECRIAEEKANDNARTNPRA